MKKALALILTLIMVLGLMPAAMAATPASQQQIGNYYQADQSREGKLEDTPNQNTSEWVYNGENQQVGVRKTISGTDEENVFDIKLEVQTKQDLKQISSANEKAAVVLVMDVSGSMKDNLQGAMKAAQDFINSFANVSNAENRKVAIVKFSGSKNSDNKTTIDGARTVQAWTNASLIKKEDGSLCDALNVLTAEGGTNIHAGLLLAKNLLSTISNDYSKNIVLFTDGEPTYHVTGSEVQSNSTEVICATDSTNTIGGGGEYTYHNDHHSVETTVKIIKEAGITPYAIYLGNKDITCNSYDSNYENCLVMEKKHRVGYIFGFPYHSYDKPYKISAWLKDAGFTAYSATSADDLSKIFTSIAEFITISAQAWQVTDPMGAMVDFVEFQDKNYENKQASYDESNKQITWKLIGDITRVESGDEGNKIYTYQLNYRIKLNTLRDGFEAGDFFATNGVTSLSYFIHEGSGPVENPQLSHVYFNVPSVKGFAGDLTFTKVDADKKPLTGAEFKITANDDPNWSMVGEISADGTSFTFSGIPSGHTYNLEETKTPVGYQGLDGNYTVEVNYGNVVLKKGTEIVTDIVNTLKDTPTGSLTIEKVFSGITPTENTFPNGITFTIQKVNDDGAADTTAAPTTVTLPIDGESNNPWSATVDLAPGTYTVTESDSDADVDGYDLTVSNSTIPEQTPTADGKTGTVTVTAGTTPATITFINTYTVDDPPFEEEGSLTIKKEFVFAEGEATEARPASIEFTVKQIVPEGQTGHSKTVTLTSDKWEETITVPVGKYTVTEVDAKIDGYTYTPVQNPTGNITVAANETAAVTFTNTYKKLPPDIAEQVFNVTKKVVQGGNVAPGKNTFNFEFRILEDTPIVAARAALPNVPGYTVTVDGIEITPDESGLYRFTIPVNGAAEETAVVKVTGNKDMVEKITALKIWETGTVPTYWVYDNGADGKEVDIGASVTFTNTYTYNPPTPTPTPKPGGGHHHYDPLPVPPVVVIPPKTGDMTIWQSILNFLGIR